MDKKRLIIDLKSIKNKLKSTRFKKDPKRAEIDLKWL